MATIKEGAESCFRRGRRSQVTNMSTSQVQVIQLENFSELCDLRKVATIRNRTDTNCEPKQQGPSPSTYEIQLGLLLVYASWNEPIKKVNHTSNQLTQLLLSLTTHLTDGLEQCFAFTSSLQIDKSEDFLRFCVGDNEFAFNSNSSPIPPTELPALAWVFQHTSLKHSALHFVPGISHRQILTCLRSSCPSISNDLPSHPWFQPIRRTLQKIESDYHLAVTTDSCQAAIRIFVAGDRSSVGKSSVCLGLLGNLLAKGYARPEELAYIKPATQSESPQLIQLYCEANGIDCVPIGPLVYYRGFTRAFLAGQTLGTDALLTQCGRAVDRLARRKRIVLIDGVGFPAVGSICGTDNACVARACSYPNRHVLPTDRQPLGVVLVGGPGVGAAVDAFNLNATYFAKYRIPVMGAIFNKLELTGFYALESCRSEVTGYFDSNPEQIQFGRRPFGFVPLVPEIAGPKGMEHVEDYIRLFGQYVDVAAVVSAAQAVKDLQQSAAPKGLNNIAIETSVQALSLKRKAMETPVFQVPSRSRQEIELAAINAGAAPSA